MTSGRINTKFYWQASGVLVHNGCADEVDIDDCFMTYLNSDGMWEETLEPARRLRERAAADDIDEVGGDYTATATASASAEMSTITPAPTVTITEVVASATITVTSSMRQRTELYSWPAAAAGTRWHYTWRSFQDSATTVGYQFFHQWQLFSRESDGPIMALNLQHGEASIYDYQRDCNLGDDGCPAGVAIADFLGKTMVSPCSRSRSRSSPLSPSADLASVHFDAATRHDRRVRSQWVHELHHGRHGEPGHGPDRLRAHRPGNGRGALLGCAAGQRCRASAR